MNLYRSMRRLIGRETNFELQSSARELSIGEFTAGSAHSSRVNKILSVAINHEHSAATSSLPMAITAVTRNSGPGSRSILSRRQTGDALPLLGDDNRLASFTSMGRCRTT